MTYNNKSTILVIIGISGDLSKRKLLPAIEKISGAKMLPDNFKIVGITRQADIKLENLLKNTTDKDYLLENIEMVQMDLNNIDDYKNLGNKLDKIEENFGDSTQYLFYLSVPPNVSKSIIELIGKSGIITNKEVKLLLEKPFGTDLKSAEELINHVNQYFKEDQIYRIDHYLAKEVAQNIIVFRDGNSLFKKTWNKDFIDKIEITVSEEIGIEGRVNFYEQTGALRDLVQSHLLQLLALVLMELPEENNLDNVPNLRSQALKQIKIPSLNPLSFYAKRGQYKSYRQEVNNPVSSTETFTSIDLESEDPKWQGVKINVRTGKALKNKFTEIKISYKKEKDNESNELIFRLQPNEGISFSVWTKRPGYEHQLSQHSLDFSFKDYYDALPEAYEQVLFSAISGGNRLFSSSQEVLETWRILDSLQKSWENSNEDLIFYEKGSDINQIVK